MFKNILCVTDLSSISKNAENAAIRLAGLFQCKLTVLSCGDYYTHTPNEYFDENIIQPVNHAPDDPDYSEHVKQKQKETQDHFYRRQNELNIFLGDQLVFEIQLENEVMAFLDLVEEKKDVYDFIIVGKENTSHWKRLLFGAPGKEICDESKIPTLLMPSDEKWLDWMPKEILVSISMQESHHQSELICADIAKKCHAKVQFIHILDENFNQTNPNMTSIFPFDYIPPQLDSPSKDELLAIIKNKMEIKVKKLKEVTGLSEIQAHVEEGHIVHGVLNYVQASEKINLLMIGSRGENAVKRLLLGSNTDVLEESCPVPVLIVFNLEQV